MRDASRRADRSERRGGLPNALFVVAAAEALPYELDGQACHLSVTLPWGSLLRGLLTADAGILAGLHRICAPGAGVELLLSLTPRDGAGYGMVLDMASLSRLGASYERCGFDMVAMCPATASDVAATHSTWAKRLGVGRERPAWRVGLVRR